MHPTAFNFQGNAALSVLTFLGTLFVLGTGGIAVVVLALRATGRPRARRVAVALGGVALAYSMLLIGGSVSSKEMVLGLHEEKAFCEIDCHLAYSVQDVQRVATLGPPDDPTRAQGVFYVVTLQTRFDEGTISERRSRSAPLSPNPRTVAIADARGRRYAVSIAGQGAYDATAGASVPLTQSLRPGDRYATVLVFDVPADAPQPRLLLCESDAVTHWLIGHENSPGHKKAYFGL